MIERLIITYLANLFWMACIIGAVALLLAKSVRNTPPAYRHVLWVLALVFASLLPAIDLRLVFFDHNAATYSAAHEIDTKLPVDSGTDQPSHKMSWPRMWPYQRPIVFTPLVSEILVAAYLAFVVYRGLSLCWSWHRTRQILRRALAPSLSTRQTAIVEHCFSKVGCRRVSTAVSRELCAPVVVGAYHPVMILPGWLLASVSDESLASALYHELVHIRRHDYLLNLFYELLLLPISFHPVALFIKAQIEQSRELACDEIAARNLPTRAAYARSLLTIAQSIARTPLRPRSGHALGLFDANTLEERVMTLLTPNRRSNRRSSLARALVASCLLTAACLTTSAFSLQVAGSQRTPALQQFAGTWEGKFQGKTFITLKLAGRDGKLSGTVSRVKFWTGPNGELTDASSSQKEDAIAETEPDRGVLHANTKVKGRIITDQGESELFVRYNMRLTGTDQAELEVAGTPVNLPAAAPWKLVRKDAAR